MRKFINIILISFLTFNLTFTSFASENQPAQPTQPAKEGTDQKAGEKIIITESVNPLNSPAESQKDAGNTGENKTEKPEGKKEEANPEPKKDESAFRDKKQDKTPTKEDPNAKTAKPTNPDLDRIEKSVDDLVQKLDKNSNLSKALSEMQSSISTEGGASKKPNEASKQTEAILKDYNQKIQTATSDSQRRKLENEAADKINSINSQAMKPANSPNEDNEEDIPEKKKKILLEVKPEKNEGEEDDRNQILALNPTSEDEEEAGSIFKNPIVVVGSVFVIVLLVAIGIVIRNNDRKMK